MVETRIYWPVNLNRIKADCVEGMHKIVTAPRQMYTNPLYAGLSPDKTQLYLAIRNADGEAEKRAFDAHGVVFSEKGLVINGAHPSAAIVGPGVERLLAEAGL